MGQCVSASQAISDSAAKGAPCCHVCGAAAGAPPRRLRRVDAWVRDSGGRWAHRHCLVEARLEDARYHHDQAAYARAKREVYPLPSTQLLPDHLLHRLPSGAEWSRTDSFRQLPLQPEGQQLVAAPAAGQASQQQPEQQPEPQQQEQQEQQEAGVAGGSDCTCSPECSCSRCSSASSLGCVASSCDSGSSSAARGSAGPLGAADARGQRVLLRRPSPVHHPALLEARTLRRLSGPHPSFDSEALQMDPDGGCGKKWRAEQEARVAEERWRRQRAAERAADANGF